DYVLHKPAQDERAAIDEAIARSLEVLPLVLSGDTQGAMLKLHTRDAEPREKPAEAPRAAPAIVPEEQQAPPPPPRASSIERVGDAAEAAHSRQAETAGTAAAGRTTRAIEKTAEKPARQAKSEEAAGAQEAAKSGKKSGLNSLLKKLIPGG